MMMNPTIARKAQCPGFAGGQLIALVCLFSIVPGRPAAAQETPAPSTISTDLISGELDVSQGMADFEDGQFESALARLSRAPAEQPGPMYYRGMALLALQRAREALTAFDQVRKSPQAPIEVDLDRAVALMRTGNPATAETVLREYIRRNPNDPYGRYFLGVALFRQEKYAPAIAEFQAASSDPALAPYLPFYSGLASYAQGQTGFQSILKQFSDTAPAGAANDLARRLSTAAVPFGPMAAPTTGSPAYGRIAQAPGAPQRPWNLALITGYEYDTNVPLAPSILFNGLGSGFHHADSRWTLSSFGEYRFVQRDNLVMGLIGSTYDTFQFRLDQFNLQDYMGGTYANAAIGNWVVGGRYEFHETLLGGRQFAMEHRLVPNLTYLEGNTGHTTVYYEYDNLNIKGFALVPAQVRSGNFNAVGVTQAFYLFDGIGRLYLGYMYRNADTMGSDFDANSNMVTARLQFPLPWKTMGNVEVRHFWDDYLNPNSLDFFGRPRTDRRVEVRVGAQKFFTKHLSGRVEYVYINNDSNVENLFGTSFYSYNRHVISTLLIYDF